MKKEHKWNKDDAFLSYFYFRHGTKGLAVSGEKDLAECVIGTSVASLKMMAANFSFLIGDVGLCRYKEYQKEIMEEWSSTSIVDLTERANSIILRRDLCKNSEEFKTAKREREKKKAKLAKDERERKELEEAFIRMGKDPNKMKRVF